MENNEVVSLYLDDIIPNRFQPREVFEEKALKELAASIKEHGVIQPIIVRKFGEKYEIIAGERRYKASVLAGLTKIPAIIRNLDDKESSKVALLENLQRRDLSPIEEARTYQKILELDQLTQFELAKTMGKSQSSIANKIRLLTLPLEIQDALLNNQISERHARSLLNLSTPEEQIEMMNKIISTRMTVRELDDELKVKLGHTIEIDLPDSENERTYIEKPIQEVDSQNIVTDFNSVNNNIDIDKLRQQSIDIIPEEKPMADMDSLLKLEVDEPDDTAPEEKSYKFIPSFDNNSTAEDVIATPEDSLNFNDIIQKLNSISPEIDSNIIEDNMAIENIEPKETKVEEPTINHRNDDIELLDDDIFIKPLPIREVNDMPPIESISSEVENINENIQEQRQVINPIETIEMPIFDLKSAINSTRSNIKNIERAGFVVDTEEIDFEDTYQIIIKIDKNK